MKEVVKRYLDRHSTLGASMQGTYRVCMSAIKSVFGTRLDEWYWSTRHLRKSERERDDWGKGCNDWIRGYWDSQDHPHRQVLIEVVSKYNPSSILEVGCNCGANLILLAKKLPSAEMIGIDINPLVVQKGNEWLAREDIPTVKLLEGKADELWQFQDRRFDIVFTDAVLIYIGPDKIKKVIKEMLRVTRKALILLEWHCFNSESKPLGVYVGHWMRDYVALLKEFVPEQNITVIKIPQELWPDKNWQRWGSVIEVIKE